MGGLDCRVEAAGRFDVEIEYACDKNLGGSTLVVKAGDQEFEVVSEETGSWRQYQTVTVGRVAWKQPGRLSVAVLPREKTPWHAISLKSIRLRPVP